MPPRLAFAPAAFADRLSEPVRTALESAAERARRAGASVSTITLPDAFVGASPHLLDLIGSEARAVLGPHRDLPLPPEIAALLAGTTADDYALRERALAYRRETIGTLESSLDPFDAVLVAVADTAPAPETTGDSVPQGPSTFYGIPAITIPIGRSPRGLPIGVALIARRGTDARLLAAAAWLEAALR